MFETRTRFIFFKRKKNKPAVLLDLPFKEEKKQDCTHVDHNYLDDPLPFQIVYTNIVLALISTTPKMVIG